MVQKRKRLALIVSMLAVCSLFIFAQGTKEEAVSSAKKDEKIIFYASGPSAMLEKLEEAFEKEHGDVIDTVQMGCGPLRQRVWTEMSSGSIKADIFWGSDPLLFDALDELGALEGYVPKDVGMFKEQFLTDKNYMLANERYAVIIYNGDKIQGDAVPRSYEDLLRPSLKGKITHADPAQSSTALAIVASLWDLFDRDWKYQDALVKNGLFLARKNSDVPSKIQEGEFDVGIAPHDAVLRLQKKAEQDGYPTPLEISWPVEGALAISRPVAMSKKDSRSPAMQQVAHDFLDFLVSKQAQMITANFSFVSVRKDVPLPQGIAENVLVKDVNWDELSKMQDYIRDEFTKISQ
ncbi:MAG TPA: extracellular solute-binding protein [Sphaerochaeta sp.]|nr:extracellular solute-binding protein [Sphaerochaeta sp.]